MMDLFIPLAIGRCERTNGNVGKVIDDYQTKIYLAHNGNVTSE